VDIKQLSKDLGLDVVKTRYWRDLLKKAELIEPKKSGNKDVYTDSDIEVFRTVKQFLDEGAETVTDAIDFIKQEITPRQALERHKVTTNQLEAAQKKISKLRKEPWWKRAISWVSGSVRRLLGRTPQLPSD